MQGPWESRGAQGVAAPSRAARRTHRIAALALGCCALMPPSAASASKVGDTPADFPGAVTGAVAGAVHIGDTPADFPRAVTGAVVHVGDTPVDFPRTVSCAVRIGDTPADFPGASGSPASIPVAAPVSHDTGGVDVPQVLAIALLSVALALALFAAVALARTQGVRRRLAGRVH